MTLRELQQLVSLGEGVSLEFKQRVPRAERIAKEVIALANTQGGRVLLGVADDGTITGVDDAGEEEFMLHRAIDTLVVPGVEYTTERIVIAPRRDVILVTVPESLQKPHQLVDPEGHAGDGTAYVRVEEMSVEASPESVRIMEEENSDRGVTFEFGETESLLMRYLDDQGRVTAAEFAKIADVAPERASQTLVHLTRAGILRLHSDKDDDYFTLAY